LRTESRDPSGRRADPRYRPGRERPRTGSDEWLYGRNAVNESLTAARRQFRLVLLLQSAGNDPRLDSIDHRAKQLGVPVERVDRETIDRVVSDVNHQGVAALATPYPYAPATALEEWSGSMLALDHLQDPQNVGTMLRAAEAFGVAAILIPKDRAASITPAAVNASAGAVEHLSIVQTVNLAQELERLKKRGLWIVGIENRANAALLGQTPIPTPCVLVVGSEGHGIGPNLAKRCDVLLKIEMHGAVNSLNAATAGSIALFALTQS
jgi:23S rRNA (guanosine2251-2'-O)-methyltransferase